MARRVALWISVALTAAALASTGCTVPTAPGEDDSLDDGPVGAKGDYTIPSNLPVLIAPEVIVSQGGGLPTLHLFDRMTGFSRVYPVALGAAGDLLGHYHTATDIHDTWFYMPVRRYPAYFEGLPFLRINKRNHDGDFSYGLHGPIEHPFRRGVGVSEGCVRMRAADIVELFHSLRTHPGTPITFQREVEYDAYGRPVRAGEAAALWAPGEPIEYGASAGERFIGDACRYDSQCDGLPGGDCHDYGFCTMPCEEWCPDRRGHAVTACMFDPDGNLCVSRASPANVDCLTAPGTLRASAFSEGTGELVEVCHPVPPEILTGDR